MSAWQVAHAEPWMVMRLVSEFPWQGDAAAQVSLRITAWSGVWFENPWQFEQLLFSPEIASLTR